MARLPVPPEELTRRNVDARHVAPAGPGVPPPVGTGGRRHWSPAVRRWWRAVLASQARALYDATDWAIAEDIAGMRNLLEDPNLEQAEWSSLQRLISHKESKLLLTARDRRAARVDVAQPIAAAAQAPEDTVEGVPDYRARLAAG